jgi:toxin YhaV
MSASDAPVTINGWSLFAHPLFLDQVEELIAAVERAKAKDPHTYRKKNAAKRLAAILKLATVDIPSDPGAARFRQGKTLGENRKHWFRAKFFQQYRLFFRFDNASRVIVLAWVNDENTLRAYDSRTDAYKVFKGMLDDGNPPDDFDTLLAAARKEKERLSSAMAAG